MATPNASKSKAQEHWTRLQAETEPGVKKFAATLQGRSHRVKGRAKRR